MHLFNASICSCSAPGAVADFHATETGSNHARVAWMPTPEPNGIVTGYVIRCEPSTLYSLVFVTYMIVKVEVGIISISSAFVN